jgi:hypothetical protein
MDQRGAGRRQVMSRRKRCARTGSAVTVSLALVATVLVAAQSGRADAQAATPAGTAKVSVDFQKTQGVLSRPEQYNNFTRRTLFPEQRPSDAAFLKSQGVHGATQRVWIDPMVCQLSTSSCTLADGVDTYMTAAGTAADSILAEMRVTDLADPTRSSLAAVYGTEAAGTGAMTPERAKPVIEEIVKTLKAKYPKLTYIEAMNEPDAPGSRAYMTPATVYPWYKAVAQAVNDVNTQLKPKVRLQVGGPAFFQFDDTWFTQFLDDYAADTDTAKHLDFFSYHDYLEFGDKAALTDPHFYKDDPSKVAGQRAALDKMLRERKLDTNIPVFITESGMYPGPLTDDASTGDTQPCPPTQYEAGIPECSAYYTTDYVRQAAGMASLQYWLAQERKTTPFNWTTRQSSNSRKDEFVSRVPAGQQIPTNTLTPYGNLLVMQSKMKTAKVLATSDQLDKGIGIYALAAKDTTGASIMVWNYQGCGATTLGAPCTNTNAFHTTIDMTHLPSNLTGSSVRERVFRIDQSTSNYYSTPATDPSQANLQQVESKTVKPGASYTQAIDLGPNALYMILLEPQHHG